MDIKKQLSVAGEGAKLVAKQAERMKVANVSLPGAYRKLGEEVFKAGVLQDKLGEIFAKIQLSKQEQEKLNQTGPAAEGFGQKMKAAAISAKNMAVSKKMEFDRGGMFSELGRLAFEEHKEEVEKRFSLSPIENELAKIATLDSEIAELGSSGKGSFFNPRNMAIGFVAVAGLALAFIGYRMVFGGKVKTGEEILNSNSKNSQDSQIASSKKNLPLDLNSLTSGIKDIKSNTQKTVDQVTQSVLQEQAIQKENEKRRLAEAEKKQQERLEEMKRRNDQKIAIDAKMAENKRKTDESIQKTKDENQRFAEFLFNQITFDPSQRFILAKSVKDLGVSISLSGRDYEPIRKLHAEKNWLGLINYAGGDPYPAIPIKNTTIYRIKSLNYDTKTVAVIKSNVEFQGLGPDKKDNSKKPSLGWLFFPVGIDDNFIDWESDAYNFRNDNDRRIYFDRLANDYQSLIKPSTVRTFFTGSTRSSKRDSFAELLPDKSGWFIGDDFAGRYIFFAEYDSINWETEFSGRLTGSAVSKHLNSLRKRISDKAQELRIKVDLGESTYASAIKLMQAEYVKAFHDTVIWAKDH